MRTCNGISLTLWLTICGSSPVHAGSFQTSLLDLNAGIQVQATAVAGDVPPPIASPKVAELVAQILDDRIPAAKRQELIRRNPELAGDLIGGLTDQLTPGTPEEARRIPWILWISFGAAKGNDPVILLAVLEEVLPEPNQPLHDWRAAAIGRGIINGLSQQGLWPLERMQQILLDQQALQLRWDMAVVEAAQVTEDEKETLSVRADAMRMLGLGTWDKYGPHLTRYLQAGIPAELQLGAIGALADLDHANSVRALIQGLPHFFDKNRNLAVDGLLRSEVRQKTLIEGLEQGQIRPAWMSLEQRDKLLRIADASWRTRAENAFKK